MDQRLDTKEEFSVIKRAKSFSHAGRGIWIFIKTTHNAWLHAPSLFLVMALGIYLNITQAEWVYLIFAGGLVLITEAINTAIEIDINLTSPDYHPYARDTKDVSAGAVLISATVALTVGLIVFVPYLL